MSDSNELKPNQSPGTPVPDLIEQYRVRRDAWIAQADELARLRDEVRGSAEREAMEIVTAARRDVRQIVMEARRELLVLSAQVQAALGEAGARPDPTMLLNRGRDTDEDFEKPDFAEAIFAPAEAVKGMLDEARADMDALTEDARTVPFQALEDAAKLPPPPEPPRVFAEDDTLLAAPQLHHPPSPPSPSVRSQNPPASQPASRMLLSSQYPSDSVPVPAGGRARLFVALFGAAGIAVLVGTIWWMRSGNEPAATEAAARSTPPASAPSPAATTSSASPAASSTPPAAPPVADAPPAAPSAALSLLVEARRSSWLRTTVDGQSDAGRMLAQGETVRLNAKERVALRVGDAGAVFVSVNNGQPAALGNDGQVVTRQFVVESVGRQAAAGVAQTQPVGSTSPQAPPAQRPSLTPSIAAGPPSAPASGPNPVPLVQPVAATPSSPPLEPGPPPPARADAAAPPAAAPRARTETPAPTPTAPPLPTPGAASPASAVVAASRQWLDAYHRQDRATMTALQTEGLQVIDDRRNEERFPANADVNRTLDRVSVQIAADTAVLTAVMTERSPDNVVPPRISPISQVWQLRGNQWRVSSVRLVSEARLNQIFR